MTHKLCVALIVAVTGGAALAGCGSSSSSSSGASGSGGSGSAASSSTSSTAASGGSVASDPAVQQAVATCKATIARAPTLTADLKTKLESICDKAATGNPQDLKQAESQVCTEVIKATVPQAVQSQALAACPKA